MIIPGVSLDSTKMMHAIWSAGKTSEKKQKKYIKTVFCRPQSTTRRACTANFPLKTWKTLRDPV